MNRPVPAEAGKWKSWGWTLAAGAAGWIANGWPCEVYPGVYALLGSVFALLAAIAFGPLRGMAAAALAAARTLLLWSHPWAIPSLVLEAGVVGGLVRRGRSSVGADVAYWAVLGVPLCFLLGLGHLGLPAHTTWAIAAKQVGNGLFAVMTAEVLLLLPGFRRVLGAERPPQDQPLRRMVMESLLPPAVLPLLICSVLYGRVLAARQQEAAASRLAETAQAVVRQVGEYLDKHLDAVVTLRDLLERHGGFASGPVDDWLARTHTNYPGFLTMLAAEAGGRMIGAHPTTGADGQLLLRQPPGIDDREYFRQPMATGQPFVSEVFAGRGFGTNPIVALAAPVRSGDLRPLGIVEGSLDLSGFRQVRADYRGLEGAAFLVLDPRDHVVYSSAPDRFPVLHPPPMPSSWPASAGPPKPPSSSTAGSPSRRPRSPNGWWPRPG